MQLPEPELTLRNYDGIPAWSDVRLFEDMGVRIAFTGRMGGHSAEPFDTLNLGNHVGDDLEVVARNRESALSALGGAGIPCVVPKQIHGTHVEVVRDAADFARASADAAEGADAVVVCAPGVAAQLSFADCLPLIVVSPTGRFAVIHAGWRGALAGIAGIGARALAAADAAAQNEEDGEGVLEGASSQARGAEADDCVSAADTVALLDGYNAYIGPYIHAECFETGADVAEKFIDRWGTDILDEHGHVSLGDVVKKDLASSGLSAERIADVDACTKCFGGYFSYRASGGECGRQGAIAFSVER